MKLTLYVNVNVVCPSAAVKVWLVLASGNDAQVTPLPTDLRY